MIKGFTYNNKGRCETDTFFLAGISGDRPPTNKKTAAGKGILLTFDGTFYSYGDSTAPGIAESFDEVSGQSYSNNITNLTNDCSLVSG